MGFIGIDWYCERFFGLFAKSVDRDSVNLPEAAGTVILISRFGLFGSTFLNDLPSFHSTFISS